MNKQTVRTPPIKVEGVSSVIFDPKTFAAKIEYLQQLRQIDGKYILGTSVQQRIDNVCDCIEKDLGIITKLKI